VGIAEIRELIKTLASEGKTIVMASHLLDEVEKVCTHVAILKTGNLITAGNVDEVLINEDIAEIAATDMQRLEAVLRNMGGYLSLKNIGQAIQLFYPMGTANLEKINQVCFNSGVVLNHLYLRKKSLETKFFELTGN
jgi:ABC-2 type transport system ATP-binding protein